MTQDESDSCKTADTGRDVSVQGVQAPSELLKENLVLSSYEKNNHV